MSTKAGFGPPVTALPAVSVIFPAYNESLALDSVLNEAAMALESAEVTFELLVVDDGSTDDTAIQLAQLRDDLPQLRVLAHERNLGYGAAITTGIAAARLQATIIMDADGQYLPSDLIRVLTHLKDHDCVFGVRTIRDDSGYRRLLAAAGNRLARKLLTVEVTDINCGLKGFWTDALRRLDLHSSGGFISTEVVLRVRSSNLRICQLPVGHRPRRAGQATGGSPAVIARIARDGLIEFSRTLAARR